MVKVKFILSIIFVAITTFIWASCTKEQPFNQINPMENTTPTPPPTQKDTTLKTYLALGDSYTIGQSVAEAGRFPMQVVGQLRQANININDPIYIATTGWTTLNLMSAINAAKLHPPYDVVSLLIGVNDQYQTRDTTFYRKRFTNLLNKAIELAGNKPANVFVLSIPDYSVTPFVSPNYKEGISKQIDQFNSINKQVTEQRSISYTDITPSTREGATNPSLIARDGLHPSESEYKKWADMLTPKIKKLLQ